MLESWLVSETNIPWNYLDANLPPRLEVKGGIKVNRIIEKTEFENYIQNDRSKNLMVTFQLRLILSTDAGESECENILLEWEEKIDAAMTKLSLNGVENPDSSQFKRLLMGISLSDRGHTLITEEVQSRQGLSDKLYKGSLYSEYIYKFERINKSQINY